MLVLLSEPGSTPSSLSDWQNAVDHIKALALLPHPSFRLVGSNIVAGAYFNVGGAIYIADSTTAISGSSSLYLKITPNGSTASASFVSSLSGVTWNQAYSGYYDVSGNLYIFSEVLAMEAGQITEFHTDAAYDTTRHGLRHFLDDGFWICPPDITEILASGIGGGGGGGGGGNDNALGEYGGGGGGGGGGGAFGYRIRVTVVPGRQYDIAIGFEADTSLSYNSVSLITFAHGGVGGNGGDASTGAGGSAGTGGAGGVATSLQHSGTAGSVGIAGALNAGGNGGKGADGGTVTVTEGGPGGYISAGVGHIPVSGSSFGCGGGGGYGAQNPIAAVVGAAPTAGELYIEW
jgi:hypothetical protein